MSDDLAPVRNVIEKLPFWLVVPVTIFLYYASLVTYAACLPFVLLYRVLLLPMVWIEWERECKDALLIYFESDHSRKWMERLEPLLSNRAVVLNWTERKDWDRSALPAQLFEMFGPRGIPERFTAHSLPAVLLFRQLRRPKRFLFGTHSQDPEESFQRLRSTLDSGR